MQEIGEDVDEAFWAFFLCFFSALGCCVLYGYMVYYMTGILVWASIVTTGVCVVLITIMLQSYVTLNYRPEARLAKEQRTDNGNTSTTGALLQWSVYMLWALVACYCLAICCFHKNIAMSIAILKTAAVIIIKNMYIMLIPLAS